MSDSASPNEIFELFQKMMNPMAFPLQSLLMPSLNVEEIEKKISELKTVEHWLKTNLGMLDLTIKTLEYQKALLSPSAPEVKPEAKNPLSDTKLWPWNFLAPAPEAQQTAAGEGETRRPRKKNPG
jgi:hypothetical protein